MRRNALIRTLTNPALLLFLFFVAAYALTAAGHLDATDGRIIASVARQLLFHNSLALPAATPNAVIGLHGYGYSKFGIALSIVEVPFVQVGYWLSVSMRNPYMIEWMASYTNSVVTALGCALFYLIARRLGASERRAIAFTLLYGLCTLAWPYAKSDFTEPLQALCLLLATYALLRARLPRIAPGWLLLAGCSLGAGVLTKSALLVVMPAFALYLLAHYVQVGLRRPPRLSGSAHAGLGIFWSQVLLWAPIAVAILLTLWLNALRFGNPLDFGYGRDPADRPFSGSPLIGVFGLLLSPDGGILFYSTPVVLALFGVRRFGRRLPRETLLIASLVVLIVGFYGAYKYWGGLSAYGPRFMVPILPFLLLPAIDAFPGILSEPRRQLVPLALIALVALAGFGEQVLGIAVSFRLYTALTCTQFPCGSTLDPAQSEILYHIWLLPPSLSYVFNGIMPPISLQSYPFGAPPVGRPHWQVLFTEEMRYFWFVYLPDPLAALRRGVVILGGIMLLCLAALGARLRIVAHRGTVDPSSICEPNSVPSRT